jgi:hypothetical protein
VLAHAPIVRGRRHRRIMEDAEQDRRIGGVGAVEVIGVELEAERDAFHQRVRGGGGRGEIVENCRAELGNLRGKQVWAVKRYAGADARMIGRELRAEIDSLLHVGLAGGELAADGEVSAPRTTAARHTDIRLVRYWEREKFAAGGIEARKQIGGNTVARRVEESSVAACRFDRAGDVDL